MANDISRRNFLQTGAIALGTVAVSRFGGISDVFAAQQEKSRVFFTNDISAAGLLRVYSHINQGITGKVGIKVHTGEPHGPNILPRDMVKALQQRIANSNLVETNTLYKGKRYTTADHRETIRINGWDFCPVDIMDEEGAVMIPVKGGKRFKEMSVGKHMLNYDSMVVLTHFKGHAMGGFGGSLKNIAIGCADGPIGKKMVHAAPDNEHYESWLKGEPFQENMVESAKATIDHFGKRIVYINVLRNMSVDCDCAGTNAAPVKARDLGILASTDLLAVDQASIDMVYKLPEAELHDLKERIESRKGLRQLSYMKELNMGNDRYSLITL
ncbi:DUF362 domain-containing protein [Geobacter sp. FeAm09]|uniref:DUF362 domain-containing protein n=1 Tax=Geobacter sp. FeAm09 TaxID=2597769 RepID=UPI0011ED82C7|nr:DUF362 domain-containing protein [Geobacter sp. FeAm09]QEM69782.1 DUF362 domain-containing protein [Geobacter sp. FeAm09]